MHDATQGYPGAAAAIHRNHLHHHHDRNCSASSGELREVRGKRGISNSPARTSDRSISSCVSRHSCSSGSNGNRSSSSTSSRTVSREGWNGGESLGDHDDSSSEYSYTNSASFSDSQLSSGSSESDMSRCEAMRWEESQDANAVAPPQQNPATPSFSSSLFGEVWRRTCVLMMLLLLQSLSQFVLEAYEPLIQEHIFIPLFLTMLIGAGGNAGNQVTVRAITGLTTGEIRPSDCLRVVMREFCCGLVTASAVALVGFARVNYFFSDDVQWYATKAVTLSLFTIVALSAILGAALPFVFIAVGLSCEHAAPTIQVVMDILGVLLTCGITAATVPAPSTSSDPHGFGSDNANGTGTIQGQ